jgi:hypothetical protein
MNWRYPRVIAVAGAALLLIGSVAPVHAANASRNDTSDASIVFAQDVSVIVGSTLREPDETTDPSAPLFGDSGVSLDLTWGQWQTAGGTANARVQGKQTAVEITLSGLVAGGVYSVFWGTLEPDSEHPLCGPGIERTLPLTSAHPNKQVPDPSSFVAPADGTATYLGEAPGNILAAGQTFFTIIYHSDGAAYHPFPNLGEQQTAGGEFGCRSSFGLDAMRQLIILMRS